MIFRIIIIYVYNRKKIKIIKIKIIKIKLKANFFLKAVHTVGFYMTIIF